jgi:xanthine dehydrogenase accessory factor
VRRDLLTLAAELARRDEPFVLATVVRREAPSSAQVGDAAVVTASGEVRGWLGGSCTTPTVAREAVRALADGRPRLVALSPDPAEDRRPGVTALPMTCHSGGSVDIYLEPVLPARRLFVFGHSPVARALVRIGKAMEFSVHVVAPDADPTAFPEADAIVTDSAGLAASSPGRPSARTWAVVATMGGGDEEALLAALALSPEYVGLVASKKRFAEMRETLGARGAAPAALARVDCPAGLDIGAKAPGEIAISILAGIVAKRSAAFSSRSVGDAPAAASVSGVLPSRPEPLAAALEGRDPVCGMTVGIATARHRAELSGRSWVFCCSGCREKFLAAPERYGAAAAHAAGDQA